MKKLDIKKIVNYIFIIYCIVLIGNILFISPKTDNVFGSTLPVLEVLVAMPVGQLGLIVVASLISMICVVLAMLKSSDEKIIHGKIIMYLVMLITSTVILCVSCIYMYHSCKEDNAVTKQVKSCVNELKGNSLNPSQININKVKTSTDVNQKYKYITIDYSNNIERKIIVYKMDNKNNKILKQYEVDNMKYVTSLFGFDACYDELDIDVNKIK